MTCFLRSAFRATGPTLVVLLLILTAPAPAWAQQPPPSKEDLTGVISGKAAARIAIGAPPTEAGPGVGLTDAAEVGQVLADDLSVSGWFGLVDPSGENRLPAGQIKDPAAWKQIGAAYLVLSRVWVEDGMGRFRVQLIETGGGSSILERTWGGEIPKDLRRMAHVAADAIVSQLTGRPGIAQTRIAFVVQEGRAKEVYLMDYDGARVRKLTKTGVINLSPSWSSDSRQMVVLSFLKRKPSIYLLDENGRVVTLNPAGGDLNSAPSFAPDGKLLVFSSDRDGNSEIYTMDPATHRETRLTFDPGIDTSPVYSPDGRQIAFTSDRSGSPQLYVMNADGSNVRRLTFEGHYNESAAWSPDGGRIAFVSRIEGQFEVLIHDLATGKETVITSGRGNKENPRWAPDGRRLVFASDRDGQWAIYAIRDDGTELRRLTRGGPAFTPDWSPVRR